MKSHSKLVVLAVILLVLYFVLAAYTSTRQGLSQPEYTVFNTNKKGTSLLFDTLRLLGHPIEISFTNISAHSSTRDVQIVIQPNPVHCPEEEIKNMLTWVKRGGKLIFLYNYDNFQDISQYLNQAPIMDDGIFQLYHYGMGELFLGPSQGVENEVLKNNRKVGYIIQNVLRNFGYEKILLNEYYHGYQQKPTIWKTLPAGFKMIVYQLAVILFFLIWLLGKRFGKPIPYYEEIEREENEYLKTLANIYKNAGMGEIIIQNYYDHFILRCAKYFNDTPQNTKSNILALWESKKFGYTDLLVEVENFMQAGQKLNTKKTADKKKFQRLCKKIAFLTEQVTKKSGSEYK